MIGYIILIAFFIWAIWYVASYLIAQKLIENDEKK